MAVLREYFSKFKNKKTFYSFSTRRVVGWIGLIFWLLGGLNTSFGAPQERKIKFIPVFLPQGQKIIAELAVTPEERQKGLMFREELAAEEGMLFLFEEEGIYSFWMKNMKFPIDIIWLDKDKRIVHIEENVPPCPVEPCPAYTPSRPACYVLELKAGSSQNYSLKIYDQLEFVIPLLKKSF